MISILAQSPASTPAPFPQPASPKVANLSELGSIQDAIKPFASLYRRTGQSVRLKCIFPTCYPSDAYDDLHDVHDILSRSLVHLHALLEALRAAGIPTSYTLSPSVTPLPLGLVFAISPDSVHGNAKMTVCEAVRSANSLAREKVFIASLENDPVLVIT